MNCLATSTTVFPNYLALNVKDLKALSLAVSASKLLASSIESNHKLPVVLE